MQQFFDLPSAIRAVETLSRKYRRGKQADMKGFLSALARSIGVSQARTGESRDSRRADNSARGTPFREPPGSRRRKKKQTLSSADRNAI